MWVLCRTVYILWVNKLFFSFFLCIPSWVTFSNASFMHFYSHIIQVSFSWLFNFRHILYHIYIFTGIIAFISIIFKDMACFFAIVYCLLFSFSVIGFIQYTYYLSCLHFVVFPHSLNRWKMIICRKQTKNYFGEEGRH